jgi:uncharacterized protein with GYD domain
MPKYMTIASYTSEGVKGLVKDGAAGRRAAVKKAVSSVGGKLEGMWFAFGSDDVYIVSDAPDNVSVAALNLAVAASGLVQTRTVVLLTVEEMDAAIQKVGTYRAPGQ